VKVSNSLRVAVMEELARELGRELAPFGFVTACMRWLRPRGLARRSGGMKLLRLNLVGLDRN